MNPATQGFILLIIRMGVCTELDKLKLCKQGHCLYKHFCLCCICIPFSLCSQALPAEYLRAEQCMQPSVLTLFPMSQER